MPHDCAKIALYGMEKFNGYFKNIDLCYIFLKKIYRNFFKNFCSYFL